MYFEFEQIKDLLNDSTFVNWVKQPDEQLNEYWSDWLQMNPERENDILLAKNFIQSIEYRHHYTLDQQSIEELLTTIKTTAPSNDENIDTNKRVLPRILPKTWLALAASLGLIIGVLSYWTMKDSPMLYGVIHYELTKVECKAGQRKQVQLPDGSTVFLNANSTLFYPAKFDSSQRVVTLIGEGFFEIVKNPAQPFIVEANHIKTTVLGTSFNIRAYADEKNTEVAVVTGKVKMEEVSSGASQLLTPHQKGIVSKGESLKRTTFEFHQVIGWKDGILIFEKDPFLDVFKKLQAWYGIEIEVDDNVVLKGHYSGEFQHDSLENIMQGIAFTSGFSYKIVDKKVFIMAK